MEMDYGNQFDKTDMERLGLFIEMPWMHGKKYPFSKPNLLKGLNMITRGPKLKCGTSDGYFEEDFKRLFIGECLKGRGRKPKQMGVKIKRGPLIPVGPTKQQSTPGDYHGTFGGKIEAFSAKLRPEKSKKDGKPNFYTSPGKKGNAGYAGICLNKYPNHASERYEAKYKWKKYGYNLPGIYIPVHHPTSFFHSNPFKEPEKIKPGLIYEKPKEKPAKIVPPGVMVPTGPGKKPGGSHAGCFEPFPEHKANKYITPVDLDKPRKLKGTVWYAHSTGRKTMFTTSLITLNTSFKVNCKNCQNYEPTYIKHLI